VKYILKAFPQMKELLLRRRHLHGRPAAHGGDREGARQARRHWSCNAKANVPRDTLKVLKDNGLRCCSSATSRQSADPAQHQEGHAGRGGGAFTKDCHELGIQIHGTFILGLPGESKETIEETIKFATRINPHTIQVSLAAPYPGTFLYKQALENGWLDAANAELINENGIQIAPLHYDHLSHTEIFSSVEDFYKRFYFRVPKIASIVGEMVTHPDMMKRRLREGWSSSAS
jgi:hypothetical protein